MRSSLDWLHSFTKVRWFIFVAVPIVFMSSPLFAQDIRIRLLDGHNGRPVNDCLNIWADSGRNRPVVVRTDKDGLAVLYVGGETAADVGHNVEAPCKAVRTSAMTPRTAATIGLWPDWAVDCRPHNEHGSSPATTKFYNVDEILRMGLSTSNTCGKFKAEPKPGELIFYVRRPHWWEAFSR